MACRCGSSATTSARGPRPTRCKSPSFCSNGVCSNGGEPMFSGSFVALITPFRDGQVDEAALRNLVEYQIRNGTDGLVPCGTTGESVTMTEEEQLRVIEIVVETANRRVPIIAGTGTNNTAKTIKLTKDVKRLGADAALVVTAYYNKPTQQA